LGLGWQQYKLGKMLAEQVAKAVAVEKHERAVRPGKEIGKVMA
jgi:hypothetical protein